MSECVSVSGAGIRCDGYAARDVRQWSIRGEKILGSVLGSW